MTRPIKFRAWSKNLLRMYEVDQIIWRRDENQLDCLVALATGTEMGVPDNFELPIQDLVIQQFTGLTDKSGKEIYEGDIVVVLNPSYRNRVEEYRKVVEWRPKVSGWSIRPSKNHEVIGNKYENPELLDE